MQKNGFQFYSSIFYLVVWVDFIVQNLLHDWDRVTNSEVSEGGEVSADPVFVRLLVAFHVLLQVLDEEWNVLATNQFLVTEFSVDLNLKFLIIRIHS